MKHVALTVNGEPREADVYPEQILVYLLSINLGLTDTTVGCDTASCGACTVLLDGEPVKSCTVRAVQANGREVTTPDALATPTQADLVEAVRSEGVEDARVLDALAAVPRAAFLPAELAEEAYVDTMLQLPHGQSTTYPSLMARIIQALELSGSEHVLEVGTGYGFQTALLARVVARVSSVERWEGLADAARANLAGEGIENAEVVAGDGTLGLPEHAPFDAIVVCAGFMRVPPPLIEQLRPGGRLVQPVGPRGHEEVTLFERDESGLVPLKAIARTNFVHLYGKWGY